MKSEAMIRATLDVVLLSAMTIGLATLAGCGSSSSGSGGGGGTIPPASGAKSVYVVEGSSSGLGGSILNFNVGSQGSIAPASSLTLPSNFEVLSVATDSAGQIYVGGYALPNLEILAYPAGSSGDATPSRTLVTSTDTDTVLIIPGR